MKILVVSLLRLGDIILTSPVLQGLRDRHPEAQIDLLINSQFTRVAELLPQVNKVYRFERDRLQAGLGEARIPLFEPFDRLDSLLDDLSSRGYDEVINLSHTRLSGWIMSLIPAPKRTGLVMDAHGRGVFGTNWFRFLNQQVDFESHETFHFTDIFHFGLGLEERSGFGLCETEQGRREADAFLNTVNNVNTGGEHPIVCVQIFSSDTKKDWSEKKWVQALNNFGSAHPEAALVLIGAPNERERLEPIAKLTGARLAIVSLAAAYSLLKKARILLTVDTSIKHLAAAAGCPTLEICLGSSDMNRTGSFLHGSVIIQSRELCAPCIHSKACHRDHHACGDRIPAAAVSMVASELYSGQSFQLATIAEEFKNEIEMCRVQNEGSFWAAPSVREPFSEVSIARWIDLACKKIWLSPSPARGSEILSLANLFRSVHGTRSEVEWVCLFEDFERQAEFVAGRMNGLKVGLSHLKGDYEDPRRFREFMSGLLQLRDRIRTMPLLRTFVNAIDTVAQDEASAAFTRFRRTSEVVGEINRRTEIYLSIIRGIRDELGINGNIQDKEERA